ncbi:MAG: ATP-dependent Clp protease ATP-binding subunit [Puniceicoccales bacterium]|jgi:ATP-dependent Clp protease ATP-binding subunit ClpC|nr:ATP-dependent Clp protease ATP-binding subunit [Puniceicoccales bacterium]
MNSMLNLTPRAQQVLAVARQEAERLGKSVIGTEHILLALMQLPQCIAISILHSMNVDLGAIRADIERLSEKDTRVSDGGNIELSPVVQRVLVAAAKEATMLQHPYIGTEHILLGILREDEGIAAKLLLDAGVKLETCRQAILSALDPNFVGGAGDFDDDDGNEQRPQADSDTKMCDSISYVKTPALKSFGHDLTEMAKENKLDPVIGREKEITRVLQILCRRSKNNPVLVGEAGVGKTAIVEGLAQSIAYGQAPEALLNKRVISLDMALMLAGTKYRGQFEERIKSVMDDIKRAKNVILFLDELHTIIGAGSSEGSMDASNILKPALSRGEVQCIGATTFGEYRKHVEKDSALERRFQPVQVDQPSVEDAIAILCGVKKCYERYHGVQYTDDAIEESVRLSARYIPDRFLPDKAIDVIDEAGARARIGAPRQSLKVKKLFEKIEKVRKDKESAVVDQDFEKAAKLRDVEKKLIEEREKLAEETKRGEKTKIITVDANAVLSVISAWSGVPVIRLEKNESERLLNLEDSLKKAIIGQDEAVSAIARAIRRSRTDLNDPNKPIGSFLFLGPTGVGKTHLAKMLSEQIFGNKDAVIQVDMSEYMEKHSVSRMVGSPPGYIGHDEGGQLTEKIRRKPYSVVLFDEVEKAHPDVLQILLQVLEDGHMTDSQGRVVDFKNTILIMTSNVGAEILQKEMSLGFGAGQDAVQDFDKAKVAILDEAKKAFRPEFINRLTEMIVFKRLDCDSLRKIVDIELAKVSKRAAEKGISLLFDESSVEFLVQKGYDKKLGARPLNRAIEKNVEDVLADKFLIGDVSVGSAVAISHKDGDENLSFAVNAESEGPADPAHIRKKRVSDGGAKNKQAAS